MPAATAFFAPEQHQEYCGQRLALQYRGTGCTLATAIACELKPCLLEPNTSIKNILLVIAGSLAIAIGAQITVPMFPVPMTLQTLVISVIGLTFGARLAALTLLAYIAEGAIGLPVFADGGFGLAKLADPTAGYIWGFALSCRRCR